MALEKIKPEKKLVYRHRLVVRITHWIGAVAMICLFMSGLQIFNAHPALYWGDKSTFGHPLMEMTAVAETDADASDDEAIVPDAKATNQDVAEDADDKTDDAAKPDAKATDQDSDADDADDSDEPEMRGITRVFGHEFTTTGVFGVSGDGDQRGFPAWITLPSGSPELAVGRRWHFFCAWVLVIDGLVYLVSSLINRHIQKDLIPSRDDLAHIGADIVDHIHLKFDQNEARKYNVLQKLAYGGVVLVAVPLIVLAGLAMSPRMDAGFPFLLHMFDGRQSARTVHFLLAFSLLAFFLLHIFMVLISGLFNNLRSMVTGWSAIDVKAGADE